MTGTSEERPFSLPFDWATRTGPDSPQDQPGHRGLGTVLGGDIDHRPYQCQPTTTVAASEAQPATKKELRSRRRAFGRVLVPSWWLAWWLSFVGCAPSAEGGPRKNVG